MKRAVAAEAIITFAGMASWYRVPIIALAVCMAAIAVGAAPAKSAEDFVGPATVQPLPDDAAKGKAPAKSPSAKPGAASQPAAPAQKAAATPGPAGKTAAPAPAPAPPPATTGKTLGPAAPAPTPKPAAPAPAKPATGKGVARPVLDTAHIHSIYLEGDFDQAIRLLDGALRGKKPLTHTDSVFIFKHLGVIYAATPSTREKGRYYMLQLISIEPTAKILDMYASDMIYLIFRNVQEEFENKYGRSVARAPAVDTVPAPEPAAPDTVPQPEKPSKAKSGNTTAYWVGGAVVAAGVAGLAYILLDNPKPKKHNIVLAE